LVVAGLFIVGTDTGVGKTVVTAALAIQARTCARRLAVIKPVASGGLEEQGEPISPDARFLSACLNGRPVSEINPICLRDPLAPAVAAEREGRRIGPEEIFAAVTRAMAPADFALIEGVGGLHVPLTEDFLVSDLAEQIDLPLLIVGRLGLGTINHTRLTVDAARQRSLKVAGVVLSQTTPHAGLAEETNPDAIRRWVSAPLLGVVPFLEGLSVEEGEPGPLKERAETVLPLRELFEQAGMSFPESVACEAKVDGDKL
jgi:dethiobiotin synthetase